MNKKYKIELAKVLLEKIRSFTLNNDLELLTLNKQEYLIINYYITELEEENEKLNDKIEFYEDVDSDRCAYNKELQKENKRLKELNAELKAITKRPTPIDYAMIQKRYEDYKSRCEKASELLQKYGNGTFDDDLLNILQNGSEKE